MSVIKKMASARESMRGMVRWLPGVLLACGFAMSAHAELPDLGKLPAMGKLGKADTVLRGDAKCTTCHDDSDPPKQTMLEERPWILAIGKTKHAVAADSRTPSCVNCHGESLAHMKKSGADTKRHAPDIVFKGKGRSAAEEINGKCQSCHQGGNRSHWEGSQHASHDVACTSCHQLHTQHDNVRDKRTQPEVCYACHKQQRVDMGKPSHHPVPEGKMGCSDCHNSHGTAGSKLLKRDSVNATCYTCHMEKRGPFLHSHQPVDEDCTLCHNPHGTTAENLLKTRPPFLCQSCHTPHGAFPPGVGGGVAGGWWNGPAITQGRSCMNCHTSIHGSNNPSTGSPTPQRFFR